MQAICTFGSITETFDTDFPEDRRQAALVDSLLVPFHSIRTSDRSRRLAGTARVDMGLEQLTRKLVAPLAHQLLPRRCGSSASIRQNVETR